MKSSTQLAENNSRNQAIELINGTLAGVLNWEDLDQIWQNISQTNDSASDTASGTAINTNWQLYKPDDSRSGIVKSQNEMQITIDKLSRYLRQSHPRDYCGIAYTDSLTNPSLVRIFDPKYLTSMCNIYGNTPAPDWVFSTIEPSQLLANGKGCSKLKDHKLGRQLPTPPIHPQVTDTLDARRMGCPLPLIHTARSLKRLAVGEVLEIISIDPGAVNDIEYLCKCTGSEHLAMAEGEYGYSFYILRK